MSVIYRFLFPSKPEGNAFSLFILALRIIFGVLLFSHGVQKWVNFDALATSFPDPLGVGSTVSLGLAIFAEVACSVGFIFGAFYRIALIPMIFTMGMAFFVIHGNDPFSVKELAFVYLALFVLLYITGPGKFSVDHIIASALSKKKRR